MSKMTKYTGCIWCLWLEECRKPTGKSRTPGLIAWMYLKPKKLYPPGYNLLVNVIAMPSEAFFLWIDEFVDACDTYTTLGPFKKINYSFFQTFFTMKTLSFQEVMYTRKCVKIGGCKVWRVCHMIAYIPNITLLLILGHSYRCCCHRYFSHHHIIFN